MKGSESRLKAFLWTVPNTLLKYYHRKANGLLFSVLLSAEEISMLVKTAVSQYPLHNIGNIQIGFFKPISLSHRFRRLNLPSKQDNFIRAKQS